MSALTSVKSITKSCLACNDRAAQDSLWAVTGRGQWIDLAHSANAKCARLLARQKYLPAEPIKDAFHGIRFSELIETFDSLNAAAAGLMADASPMPTPGFQTCHDLS